MYTKEFVVRWNDLDANKHLGNSEYIAYMSDTRMSFLEEYDIGLDVMTKHGLGPIVFYEQINYFKEIRLGDTITVSLTVNGHSEDGRFVVMEHNFYNSDGENLAHSEILFSWIIMESRRLGRLTPDLQTRIRSFPRSKDFKILSKDAIKKFRRIPVDLNEKRG